MVRWPKILVSMLVLSAGCAVGSPPDGSTDEPSTNLRTEDRPNGPSDRDMGVDPGDVGSMQNDGCPVGACVIDETRCDGEALRTCEADSLRPECGIWSVPVDCAVPGETCVAGVCITPTGCVDNDGDAHGVMCAAGDDCDDADATAYIGAIELCDEVDNDCDGMVDEGYQIGTPCTYGAGTCQADGTIVCGPDGGTICSGMAVGQPEVCDGVDNDCNGIVDDGVCVACRADIFEPNDTPQEAELVQPDAPKWGLLCPGDTDWFTLETQSNVTYHVYVTFPEQRSDLLVQGWVDGVNVVTGDTTGRDYEVFVVNGDATKTFQIEVIDRDVIDSFFRIVLVSDRACASEDGFTPNQTIQTAAQLPESWLTKVYMCDGGLSDWYAIGDLTAGAPFFAGIAGEAGGTDLDLHLWGDPDGDNVFERVETSATFDNVEEIDITTPHTGRFYLEVVDFDGLGGSYDIGWSAQ